MNEYQIQFPIGDWSGDGHGKCDWFTVKSNKPVEEVREIHFQMSEKLGINIEEIAEEYEDDEITEEVAKKLSAIGLDVEDYAELYEYKKPAKWRTNSEGMIDLWIDLLMKVDSSLELKVIRDIPTISFYGFDEKHRCIEFVGYGCFWD